jgi:hypothetical protein
MPRIQQAAAAWHPGLLTPSMRAEQGAARCQCNQQRARHAVFGAAQVPFVQQMCYVSGTNQVPIR